jgi:lipopolysaccharide heptosyltransferase II
VRAPASTDAIGDHGAARTGLHNILVIGPSWVGDTILAQPLLRRLREQHPDAQVDVLAPAWTLPLLQRMPEVTRGIASPFAHGELDLRARLVLARDLRARRYDQAVVLPNSFKSALIPWLVRIPLRTGYVGEFRYVLLNDARRLDPHALPTMAERYAALAQPRGEPLHKPLPPLHLTVDPAAREQLLLRLGLSLSAPAVCICPGAEYGPAKRWPVEHFAELARQLRHDGFQVWIIGSNKDRELGAEIAQRADGAATDLTGHTTLEQVVDLLSCAQHVVSNDSGLMHVAAALGVSLVALYGSSSPTFTPPLSARARILKLDLPCSPCYKRECPLGHFNCMRQLSPRQVHDAFIPMQMSSSTDTK